MSGGTRKRGRPKGTCMACASGLPEGQCTTKNVVYKLTRKECGQFYIGETGRELAQRVAGHTRDAKNRSTNSP